MSYKKNLLFVRNTKMRPMTFIHDMTARGWNIKYARSFDHAYDILSETPCDVGLAYVDTQELNKQVATERVRPSNPIEWVAVIDQPTLDDNDACLMLSQSFYAYHILPIDAEQVDCLLNHALAMTELTLSTGYHQPVALDQHEMVGTTPVMQKLLDTIRRVAAVEAPVFISGESGTGKELVARAIHERSPRAEGPFIAINCGALPSNLIQSELFGHEKGAFTGASQRKIGRIEVAQGGTLFLDEIGDLPLEMQINLLRFLEDHKIQRVGGRKEISVDVRVLTATHVDLDKAVKAGKFREDLYHRLNVLQIQVPPLRERQEDVEILARFFFDMFSSEKSTQVKGFSQESLALMRYHDWPGNIRELINRVRRAMVMCENRLIRPADLGLERRKLTRNIMTLEQARDNAECEAIRAALARNKYKIQNAATDLGVSRVTLYRLMEKHRVERQTNGTK